MKYKILCTDGFSSAGVDELKKDSNLDVTFEKSLSHEELLKKIPKFDALIVRSASSVSEDVINEGKNLKIVARAGVGTDNIDIKSATKNGILVVNAPSGNTLSTAELSFAMLMSLCRNIPQAAASMKHKKWEKSKFKGVELAHKTIGVIGLGRIGKEVARRALAFKMDVLGYDPFLEAEKISDLGLKPATLDDIYKTADFITVHTPLTEKTKNLISFKEMQTMKKTARIVNCARGGIINEEDLAKALKEEVIAGAALDVYTSEPFDGESFKELNNCILTPHLGASTAEAQEAVAIETARAVSQFFQDGISFNTINLPEYSGDKLSEFRNHMILAEKLGVLAAEALGEPFGKFVFGSRKSIVPIVTLAAIKGSLKNIVGDNITFVNAKQIATERGIGVVEEVLGNEKDFSDIISVKLASKDVQQTVEGAVLSDGAIKIVKYLDYNVEVEPFGPILFINNDDTPGVIGRVCTVLGKHKVNIAEMQNVRKGKGESALTVIRIDDKVDKQVLTEVEKEKGVNKASQVCL